MNRHRWVEPALVLVVFLVAFLPRAIYPISRPVQWYTRSVMFIQSVLDGDWGETAYSEHPGVTTMWLSGFALRLAGVAPEQRPEGPYVDPNSLTARESAIGVLPLALVIAALIELAYLLLVRLFNRTVAFSAALLVALDPFFLANSKVLHVDGLLAAFMCSSALALLLFVSEGRWYWVVLSGVLGGLALLTKSPALFLWPYTALCLGVSILVSWADHIRTPHSALHTPHSAFPVVGLWRLARRNVLAGLAWLGALVLVYWTLFPAMWVAPLETLKSVYTRAFMRVGWAHPNPLYFLGRAFVGDPGPLYYLYTWGYKVTSVVAVFALVALLAAAFGKGIPRRKRTMVGLIFAFALFFTIQMLLGAKKMPRYLLPAFPMVDVLAGVGLVWWAERTAYHVRQIANRKSANLQPPTSNLQLPTSNFQPPISNLQSPISLTLIAICLLLQAALLLPRHPYYDTYFSELMGGARSGVAVLSTQWQGEGLDLAARRLNALPEAGQQTVGSHRAALFQQYFVGQTVDVEMPADWYVLGIHNVLKGGEEGEEQAVDLYRRRRAWDSVVFGGIPYVWIYRAATGPDHPAAFAFEQGIRLVGYDVAPPPYAPGQTLRLQVYWLAQQRPPEDYTVFVHLLDEAGQLVAQQDNPPVRGTRPTSTWEPGAVIVDPYDLSIPGDAAPGEYILMIGLYRWPELTRLPVRDQQGARLPDDRASLATVSVEREPPAPATVWVARGLACLVVLGAAVGLGRQHG